MSGPLLSLLLKRVAPSAESSVNLKNPLKSACIQIIGGNGSFLGEI